MFPIFCSAAFRTVLANSVCREAWPIRGRNIQFQSFIRNPGHQEAKIPHRIGKRCEPTKVLLRSESDAKTGSYDDSDWTRFCLIPPQNELPRASNLTDTVSVKTRSRIMSSVRGKDTQPELLLRRRLHRSGYRYRLHAKELPGRPDLVFPRWKAVVFVNGCFWHGHDCHRFNWPETRTEFWRSKILGNKERDTRNHKKLLDAGWRVCIVWDCSLHGRGKLGIDTVVDRCERWLSGTEKAMSIHGLTASHDSDTALK